jgi:Xaa-Pro aminopeptidase
MPAMAKRSRSRTPETSDPFAPRLRELRRRLRDGKIDALLVTEPKDIRYLTGFIGEDSWLLIPLRGTSVHILSDSRFEEQIAREAPQAKAVMRKGSIADATAKLCDKLTSIDRVGVQPGSMTLAVRMALIKSLGGARRVVPIDDGLLRQRSVKSDEEVAAIEAALRIQERAFGELCHFIEPGMREYEAAAYLEYRMRALGADGRSFPTITAVGANAALPHAVPGDARIEKNELVLIDWGARKDGYCGDLTRVVALGSMPAAMREVYEVVLEAQLAGIEAVRPGAEPREVDAAARKVIEDAGYGDRFGHGLGHGLGLAVHEQPALSPRAKEGEALEVGQVVTVEPGVYVPGVGGVRIEDDVLVTAGGKRVLSRLPKTLESAII